MTARNWVRPEETANFYSIQMIGFAWEKWDKEPSVLVATRSNIDGYFVSLQHVLGEYWSSLRYLAIDLLMLMEMDEVLNDCLAQQKGWWRESD